MRAAGGFGFSAAVLLCAAFCVAARQPPANPSQETASKAAASSTTGAATIPAKAIEYGDELLRHATPKMKTWAESYAHKKICDHRLDPKGTMAEVDTQFAKASDEVRDAIIYLVFHVAYREDELEQRTATNQLRRIDDDMQDTTRQIVTMRASLDERMTSVHRGISAEEMSKLNDGIQNQERRLRDLAEERRKKRVRLATLDDRITRYYKLFSVTHPRMEGVAASILDRVE